jgi:superfamily II DNA or RNA helicase
VSSARLIDLVPGQSFLEEAFVRWVLSPAAGPGIAAHITPQHPVPVPEHTYQLDYLIAGSELRVAIELDGFAYHSDKRAFVYDRVRQNDLVAREYAVLRFSYGAIRDDTARCVAQLRAVLRKDPVLAPFVNVDPIVPVPDDMVANPLELATPPPAVPRLAPGFFDLARQHLALRPLRECQREAIGALANYYRRSRLDAACVMSVGAGKTALGIAAALAFTRRRALIVTPGRVIRGTFATALDHNRAGNTLYTLPGGPLIPGCRPPRSLVLDRSGGPIQAVEAEELLAADMIVTNYHSLVGGEQGAGLLAKLGPDDIDFIVIDEAHIAAADSYRQLFARFPRARRLLMSACFSRADGQRITADVVYRYRLIDSIADGHAKHLNAHRFSPRVQETTYEIRWPDGQREQIIGKDALLEVMRDERKLARITATSEEPIRKIMHNVRTCLDTQRRTLAPVRPRVLFAALGQRHAEQISRIANEHGIACAPLHHSMSDTQIAATRARFEAASGNLDAIVQLKMLGQGYDLPAITIVVPMRPYGSFGEFYQFIGRGIRIIQHPVLADRTDDHQRLDVVYHGELGLDAHLETLRAENDMDPHPADDDDFGDAPAADVAAVTMPASSAGPAASGCAADSASAVVLEERGNSHQQFLHDTDRIEARRQERELHVFAQRYATYAATTPNPQPFTRFVAVIRSMHD